MHFGNLNGLKNLAGLGVSSNIAFSPNQISGLSLWFDATTSVFSDGGTTPATDGQTVAQWNDLSLSAKNLTAVGSAKPTYNTNIQNGKPGITFDGVANVMATGAMTLNQPTSVFAVMNQKTWTAGGGMFDGNVVDNMLFYQVTASPDLRMYGSTGGATQLLTTLAINTFGVVDLQYNGLSSFYRLNNGSHVAIAENITGTPGGLTLGREIGFNFGNVIFCEFIVYGGTAVTDAQATLINRYLGNKWGITVS